MKADVVGGCSGLQCRQHGPQEQVPLPVHVPESGRNEKPEAAPSGGKQRPGVGLGMGLTTQFHRRGRDHPLAPASTSKV